MVGKITKAIYDLDGLLLDTEPFYTRVNHIIVTSYGKVFDWSVKSKMIGLPTRDSARVLIETLKLPVSIDEYLRRREHMLAELFPQAEPMPGAVRLTRHLKEFDISQGVATSSDRRHFELKTTRHKEWFSIFESFVLGDDPEIMRGKPAPDVFLIAAQRLHASPEQCLVFEDSPAGVKAARAAGMFAIAVPDPNMDRLAYSKAHQVLDSLEDFDPSLWGLPLFR